ncbi:uncharacterized protein dok7 isoform X4 [Electrophorus electricus]|uniref:uncharacterized protein dok7 isoform X4 n=1 Tax=Electrophorus electricus TaxID=8005 RepID=UPI0015D08081|nr:uncharacterized protein dok7 isoform X4 [Electrophorus electricus]
MFHQPSLPSGGCRTCGATGRCPTDSSLKEGHDVVTGLVSSFLPVQRVNRSAFCSTVLLEAYPPAGHHLDYVLPYQTLVLTPSLWRRGSHRRPVNWRSVLAFCLSAATRAAQASCSLLIGPASHSSYNTSLAGDDRSISSSSSDTSHSDTSMSIRLAIWPDPVRSPTPSEASVPSPGAKAPKPLNALARASSEERLYGMVMGGVCPPSKQPRPRALQEAGRQSSTDSGIATGSHSSYSGSLSSYTGSLDTAQAETDEFGSLLSLSTNFNTNPNISPSLRLLQQFQPVQPSTSAPAYTSPQVPEHRRCACQVGASQRQDSEYQVPSQVPQHYDIPRRLGQLHPSTPVHAQRSQHAFLELSGTPVTAASAESGERTVPPGGFAMPRQALCPVCGGLKTVIPSTPTGIPSVSARLDKPKNEMWSTTPPAASEGLRRIISPDAEERSGCELTTSYAQPMSFWEPKEGASVMPVSPMSPLRLLRQPSLSGRSGPLAREASFTFPDRFQADSANYVNIPVSPMSKRQLNYMELDLQDMQESGYVVRGASSTKYAHIDIGATEAAQRVGAQHAQGREERLQELEQRRRGTLT